MTLFLTLLFINYQYNISILCHDINSYHNIIAGFKVYRTPVMTWQSGNDFPKCVWD